VVIGEPISVAPETGKETPKMRRSPAPRFRQTSKDIGNGLMEISKAAIGLDLDVVGGIRNFGNPYKLAKRLFLGLRKGTASSLYICDFEPFFDDELERGEAFKIFDGDENGNRSLNTFKAM
jgi:hypothetical protein